MEALQFVNDILLQLSYPTVTTIEGTLDKETDKVVRAANSVLASLQGEKDWDELTVDEAHLLLEAYDTHSVTVSAVYGNTALTVGTPIFVAGDVGKLISISGDHGVSYRIAAVASSTIVSLDRPWAGEDLVAAESTVYIGQDTYDMPTDYNRMLTDEFISPASNSRIAVVGARELAAQRRRNGFGMSLGTPIKATIHGMNTTGTARQVHIDSIPATAMEIEYSYLKQHPDLDADDVDILYPIQDLLYIKDMVVARLKRDSELAQTAGQVASDALRDKARVQSVHDAGKDRMRISPRRYGRIRRRRR